jgi:hypothetical protein
VPALDRVFTGRVVLGDDLREAGGVDMPFTLDEARARGLERWQLRSRRRWRRVGPHTYAPARRTDDPLLRLEAAACRLPAGAAFGGLSAAWLHGIDVQACDPIEAIVPNGMGVSARSGMRVYRSRLPADDVTVLRGLRATSVLRTLEDIGRRMPLVEGTAIADMALNLGLTDISTFVAWARTRTGGRGLVNLRRTADLAEPRTESPMETRLRLVLVLAGLPRPEAQVSIYDRNGNFVGRPDLYYGKQKLGIEYDGGVHRNQLAEDNRRQNLLLQAGVRLLRFTAADVLSRPALVVAQVRAMLAQ